MGLRVVAEGVEDQAQMKLLSEYGVDEIQGYLLGKPVVAESLQSVLLHPERHPDAASKVVPLHP